MFANITKKRLFNSTPIGSIAPGGGSVVGVSGSGTVDYFPKFTAGTTIGDSLLQEYSGIGAAVITSQATATGFFSVNTDSTSGAAGGFVCGNNVGYFGAFYIYGSTQSNTFLQNKAGFISSNDKIFINSDNTSSGNGGIQFIIGPT